MTTSLMPSRGVQVSMDRAVYGGIADKLNSYLVASDDEFIVTAAKRVRFARQADLVRQFLGVRRRPAAQGCYGDRDKEGQALRMSCENLSAQRSTPSLLSRRHRLR